MTLSNNLPWTKIHSFLIDVGNVREPKEFSVQVVKRLYSLIPYDQARVYFVNDCGKLYDEYLIGVDQIWSNLYREYYSRIDNGRYSIPTRHYSIHRGIGKGKSNQSIPKIEVCVYDWTDFEYDEFTKDYIKPQRLGHSAGFGLHSTINSVRSVFCLDRTSLRGYTRAETDILKFIQPLLDNLHQNLFVHCSNKAAVSNPTAEQRLTKRESEIADLLCRGMTPAKISSHLCLSLSTVYRHIANMHAKLEVSNRQELLLKLMDGQDT